MKRLFLKLSVCTCLGLLIIPAANATADDGHNHGDESPTPTNANAPKRQASGQVFLPKPAQRQLSVRTKPVQPTLFNKILPLNGQVVLDPQMGGVIQASQNGRFTPATNGVPRLGHTIKKGQILGYMETTQAPIERANQQAQLSHLKSQLGVSQRRLERIESLKETIPKKELETVRAEVSSLKTQINALSEGVASKETLKATSTGVLTASYAIAGQLFNAGETLFEVRDPRVLRIEATWYGTENTPAFEEALVTTGSNTIRLAYLGASGNVKNQSISLIFESRQVQESRFLTGQLIKVYAKQSIKVEGIAIPSSAIVKNSSNQNIVWIKKDPETFESKVVVFEPLNGNEVLVIKGLSAGDRVVTQGVTLLNQIR